MIDVVHCEGADLLVGRGVQQGEQPGEPFMRVGLAVGPAAQQLALCTGLEESTGEPALRTQPQRMCWVDEQQSTVFSPADEGSQQIGLLVAGLRGLGEEGLQVGGGDCGPADQAAAAGEVRARSRRIRSFVSMVMSLPAARPSAGGVLGRAAAAG